MHEGEHNPPAGWIGGPQGPNPAPQLRLVAPMPSDYAEFITVLCPFTGGTPGVAGVRFTRPDPNLTLRLEVDLADGRRDVLRWATRLCAPLAGHNGRATLVLDSAVAAGLAPAIAFRCF